MAYLDCDPFDNYVTLSTRYDLVSGSCSISSAAARFPAPSPLTGQGMTTSGAVAACFVRKNLTTTPATLILGVACKISALPSSSAVALIAFWDTGGMQCSLGVNSAGQFQFYRGNPTAGGTAVGAASATGLMQIGIWHYLEVVVTIDPSVGAVALYVDQPAIGGVAAISSTGLNTRVSANSYANQYSIGDHNSTANVTFPSFDDLYVFDTTTAANNARLGDQRMYTEMPNGVGASTQWSPTGAAANWQAVSEIPPDGDATYVSSNTPGQTDLYTTQSAGLGATAPNFVVVRRQHRKDDASVHTDQSTIRSGSSTATSTAVSVPSSYSFVDDIYNNDPATSAPWATGTAADNAQIGVVETS